jgi:hypothetical protein
MTQKQALISIILFIAVIAGGLFAFYYLQFKPSATQNQLNDPNLNPTRPPSRPTNTNGQNSATSTTSSGDPNNQQGNDTEPNQEGGETPDQTVDIAPRLRRVIENPVAGSVIFASTTKNKKGVVVNTETIVRLTDSTNGKIYETRIGSSSVAWLGTVRIPTGKVEEIIWTKKGDAFYMRYANNTEDIETVYTSLIHKKTASTTISGEDVVLAPYETKTVFLPKNILQLVTSEATNPLFYLLKQSSGVIGVNADQENKKPRTIFTSSTSEWLAQWPNLNIHLTTKPSGTFMGTHFFLNPTTGTLNRISGDVFGLTSLSDTKGERFIVSGNERNNLGTGLYVTKTGSLDSFPVVTVAEKCVWGIKNPTTTYCAVPKNIPSGTYPDMWYQGMVSFNDSLIKINTLTNETQIILDPEKQNSPFIADMIDLQIDKKDEHISFRNKRDGTMWILRIER